jgi:predicted enzyme related to lactoylglutathione lyase
MLRTAPIRAYIPAADISRARNFYEGTLELKPKAEYAGGVIYECGGAEVFMYPTRNAGTSKASQAFWQVDDVEAEVAKLKARGVKFEEYDMPGVTMKNSILTGGGAKTAWFKDTEEISWLSAKGFHPKLIVLTSRRRPEVQLHGIARDIDMHEIEHVDPNCIVGLCHLDVARMHRKPQGSRSIHHFGSRDLGRQSSRGRIFDQLVDVALQFPVLDIGRRQHHRDDHQDE